MAKRKTLSFTGMDAAEEDALKQAFAKANRQLGNSWEIAPEAEAEVLVVDVDTIYGHMTWLRMHNSGRPIVALSSSSKAEADHVLTRPVDAEKLAQLLAQFDGGKAAAAEPASRESAAQQQPAKQQPAQRPAQVQAPAAAPAAAAEPAAPPMAAAPAPDAPRPVAAAPASAAPEPAPEPQPEPEPEPPPPPRDPVLADYFEPGALPGPVKLSTPDAPVLALDPQKRQYVAPASLKPLIPYCKRVIHPEDWTAITPAELEKLKAEHGAHPFSRLLWLFALSNGEGQLAAGYDINEKFRLTKWPQIEREYPKHFRIATVMMKQPATLPEIAEQSGAPLPEVIDFVNAYLATGFAEMEHPPEPVDPNAQARAGFLGRLRGQRSG